MRASAVGATRRRLRADVAFYEAFPRWFALRRLVTTPTEAETVQALVRERCGGLWHDEAARHAAHHPCLHKRAAPTLQNMTGSDFMQVSAYLHLHTHMDSARLVAQSLKVLRVLRHVHQIAAEAGLAEGSILKGKVQRFSKKSELQTTCNGEHDVS